MFKLSNLKVCYTIYSNHPVLCKYSHTCTIVQEGTAEVQQGKGDPQSRLRIPPECLGQKGEILQECLDGAEEITSPDPEDLDVGED